MPGIHVGPASPEGKALERIAAIPEADRVRDTERALEVLVFEVESGKRGFGELRLGVLFGPSSMGELLAAWPPQAKAAQRSRGGDGPGGPSRRPIPTPRPPPPVLSPRPRTPDEPDDPT